MTEATIFQATPDVPKVDTTQVKTLPQEVAELIGAGKKYATEEDALKSVPHAQKHIKTLEEELAQVKQELEKRRTAAELLDEIKSGIKPQDTSSGSITADNVAQVVEQVFEKRTQQQTAVSNISRVTSAFTEKFADKAEEMFKAIANESGLSVQELNRLAASSPSAVLKLAGITGKQVDVAGKVSSSVNTEGLPKGDNTSQLSARVKSGASTKDMVSAWRIAGQKIGKPT